MRTKDCSTVGAEHEDKDHPVTAIIDSIEKHWEKADQDLFLATLFLNPFFKASAFNPQKMTLAMLIGIL